MPSYDRRSRDRRPRRRSTTSIPRTRDRLTGPIHHKPSRINDAPNGNERRGPTHLEGGNGRALGQIVRNAQRKVSMRRASPDSIDRAKTKPKAKGPDRSSDSIIAALLAAARPPASGGGGGYAQIDIGSVVAPYDQAIASANTAAEQRKVLLQQYAARSAEAAKAYSQDTAAAVAQQQAAQRASAAGDVAETQAQAKATAASLAAQGIDPGVQAAAAAEGQANVAQRKGATADEAADLATQKRIAAEAGRDAQYSAQDVSNVAGSALQDTLLSTVLGLQQEKAGARSSAEAQNAQLAAQASSGSDADAQAYMQNLAQLISGVSDQVAGSAGDPSVYETPGRGKVTRWINNYDKRNGGDGQADDALRYAVQGKSEEEANSRLDEFIKEQTKRIQADKNHPEYARKHPNGIRYNQQFLRDMIHNYYRTSEQIRGDQYDDLMERVLLQVGLLGLA